LLEIPRGGGTMDHEAVLLYINIKLQCTLTY